MLYLTFDMPFADYLPFNVSFADWHRDPTSLEASAYGPCADIDGWSKCIVFEASNDCFKGSIRNWQLHGLKYLRYVQKIKIVGAGTSSPAAQHTLSLSSLRWILSLVPNCTSVAFIGLTLESFPYPFTFPTMVRTVTSVYIAACSIHTTGRDAAASLSEFSRLREGVMLGIHWIDGLTRETSDGDYIRIANVSSLQFAAVCCMDAWRIGRAIHAGRQSLRTLHLSVQPFVEDHRAYFR